MFKNPKTRKRLTAATAILCVLSLLIGVAAYFTDRESASAGATAGNMDLVFTDISASKTGTNGITSNNEFALDKSWENSIVADGAIINPGDYFDFSFELSNTGSKSMDVRQQLIVTSTTPMTEGAEEYTLTIIGGNNSTAVTGTLSDDKMSITYDLTDIILDGSVETETGAVDGKHIVRLDFASSAGNAFMGSAVSVSYNAQAKQHRNTDDSDWANWGEVKTKFEQIGDTLISGLGSVSVENGNNATFNYDKGTGELRGVVPPSEGEETPPEIPEEDLPEIIEFTGGKFETITSYTPGTYETVEYETTYTVTKYPVSYSAYVWSQWLVTNNTLWEPYDISITDVNEYYSDYIVYSMETDYPIVVEGVAGDSLELYTINIDSDDTEGNAVYMAAYLNKATGTDNYHVAQWDGSKYVAGNFDSDIVSVTTFTETYTVTNSKEVLVTAPSTTTEYVFVPTGTMNAEAGMTWAEWLVSEYNTTGITDPVIRNINYEIVSSDSTIVAGESYSIMEYVPVVIAPGLYESGTNYGTLLKSWDELVDTGSYNDFGKFKSDGTNPSGSLKVESSTKTLAKVSLLGAGDLIFANDGSIETIVSDAFSYSGLTSVVLNGVTGSLCNTFIGSSDLTNVVLCDGITVLQATFADCSKLTSVTIPASVKQMVAGSYGVFENCTNLTSITYEGTKAQWNSISKASGWNTNTGNYTIHCTDGDISK